MSEKIAHSLLPLALLVLFLSPGDHGKTSTTALLSLGSHRGRGCMHSSSLTSVQLVESSVSLLAVSSYTIDRYPLAHEQASGLCGILTH